MKARRHQFGLLPDAALQSALHRACQPGTYVLAAGAKAGTCVVWSTAVVTTPGLRVGAAVADAAPGPGAANEDGTVG